MQLCVKQLKCKVFKRSKINSTRKTSNNKENIVLRFKIIQYLNIMYIKS